MTTVVVDLDDLRTVTTHARHTLGDRHRTWDLKPALAGIEDAIHRAGTGTGPLTPQPQWEAFTKLTRTATTINALGAWVRDRFDTYGLSVHDEATMYTAVTTCALLVELAIGSTNGAGGTNVVEAAGAFTWAVAEYLPVPR